MARLIINLRGTSGTGKTTAARALISASEAEPYENHVDKPKRVRAYKGKLYGKNIFILGSYQVTCGGMDTVNDINVAAEMVTHYGAKRDAFVFYEGLFISHMYGTVGEATAKFGDKHIFAFLDTPLETALDNVRQRRLAKGNTTEFNPTNTIMDYRRVQLSKARILRFNRVVEDVPYERAGEWVLNRFKAATP